MNYLLIESATVAFLVTFVALFCLLRVKVFAAIVDKPNQRSLHDQPVPRTGGLAIMAGIITSWLFAGQSSLLVLSSAVIILVILSFLDDMYGLPVVQRLAIQCIVAAIYVYRVIPAEHGLLIGCLALLAIVWMTNLFNFMDGSDGLAGGMVAFGFSTYAYAAWTSGYSLICVSSMGIVAASIAFLCYNFHPARIFMGDAGAIPLGFLAAAFGLMGWQKEIWPLWFPVLVFSPFIVDASVTLAKRLIRGEKFWQAHRSHYYQRLIQLGWGHRKTACAEYTLMILVGLTAILLQGISQLGQLLGLLVWCVIYCILAWKIDSMWSLYKCKSVP